MRMSAGDIAIVAAAGLVALLLVVAATVWRIWAGLRAIGDGYITNNPKIKCAPLHNQEKCQADEGTMTSLTTDSSVQH